MLEVLDAGAVRRWCRAAACALDRARDDIDALNVFPVPDRDTGTNLHLTVVAAADAADRAGTGCERMPDATWREVTRAVLLDARGNSGVIVSQVLRGVCDVLAHAGPRRGSALREGLRRGAELAYAAVAHPVEGTVLSVARAAADAAERVAGDDLAMVARGAAEGARAELRCTPERLDVLSSAGVVDAGGAGLCVILDALVGVVTGEEVLSVPWPPPRPGSAAGGGCGAAGYDGPAYEVMYLLDTDTDTEAAAVHALRSRLDAMGDSLVIVGGEGLWNVHVHADDPGAALESGLAAGRPHRIRVTYLHGAPSPGVRGAEVVAVVAGDGLARLFGDAGATPVRREPGQPPPLTPVLDAVRSAGGEVVLLPGDRALLPMTDVVAERARAEGVHVAVIPTHAYVQGLAALAVHDRDRRFDDDVIAMTAAAGATRAAEVVIASGAAVTSAGVCRPGDVLGLIEGDVAVIGSAVADVACQVVDRMLSGGGEVVTLVVGEPHLTGVADRVPAHVRRTRPDVDTLVYEGGAPGCPLQIGVE